jgi:hypothetical protein
MIWQVNIKPYHWRYQYLIESELPDTIVRALFAIKVAVLVIFEVMLAVLGLHVFHTVVTWGETQTSSAKISIR